MNLYIIHHLICSRIKRLSTILLKIVTITLIKRRKYTISHKAEMLREFHLHIHQREIETLIGFHQKGSCISKSLWEECVIS
jgi:hypothetical protein